MAQREKRHFLGFSSRREPLDGTVGVPCSSRAIPGSSDGTLRLRCNSIRAEPCGPVRTRIAFASLRPKDELTWSLRRHKVARWFG